MNAISAAFLIGLTTLTLVPATATASALRSADFLKDVKPILDAYCVKCHGPEKAKSGLRLDNKADAFRGGDVYAPDIVPGKSGESPLIQFLDGVSDSDEGVAMPPKDQKARPSAEQIAILRAWVDQGAPWPDVPAASASSSNDPREHWSFRRVVRSPLPQVRDESWVRSPIDRFLLARLEREGLAPSPAADRLTMIRRLSFDLWGLPPSPEDAAAFVNDPSPDADAYEALVERLLASPRYGERWARHWLDVVRFAESNGFEMNQARPNAWPYRDYVIRALNEDKPYDRFIREQIAGDALGIDEATGFLVAGPWDQVKSPDPVLTAQQRSDELHDMVSVAGSAFLGLTVGCARCHNHKFDPIAQTDYYAMIAVFSGVQHGERAIAPKLSDEERAARDLEKAEALRRIAELDRRLETMEPLASVEPKPARRRAPIRTGGNIDRFAPIAAKFVRFTITTTNSGSEPCLDELEIWTAEPTPRNVALASAGAKATASGTLPGFAIHKLEHIHDGLHGNSRSWISNEPGKGWVQIELPRTLTIDRVSWSRDRTEPPQYRDRIATGYRIEVAETPDERRTVATSDDRALESDAVADAAEDKIARPDASAETMTRIKLQAERQTLRARLKTLDARTMIYAGRFAAPEPTHRLHRGDPMQPREPVVPGALAQFGAKLSLSPSAADAERRQALAGWIVDPAHPLTARVMVNRVWQHHFGEGIVATPSDFGRNGARPSHPELLDWLASEFVAQGWRLKPIHRLIVRSSAYRQASAADPRATAKDSGNRWLWRASPRRLEAEPLRDAILAVSGRLDLGKAGGPGFDLFQPNANYVKVYTPKTIFGPAEFRRMIYQAKPRMQLDDVFGAFDCPDAGQIAPKRTRSTTPLQAFNLLNSPFLVQQSQALADRLRRDAAASLDAQVRRGFQLAFQRDPEPEEANAALELAQRHGLPALCRALLNSNEFVMIY